MEIEGSLSLHEFKLIEDHSSLDSKDIQQNDSQGPSSSINSGIISSNLSLATHNNNTTSESTDSNRRCTRSISAAQPSHEEQQIATTPKKKRIRKRKPLRRAGVVDIIPNSFSSSYFYYIYADIIISKDLEIRLGGALIWGMIGTEFMTGTKVTQSEIGVEVELKFKCNIPKISMKDAITKISQFNIPTSKKFKEALLAFDRNQNQKKQEAIDAPMSKYKQEAQYEVFCDLTWQRILETSQTESLFCYGTGRADFFTNEVSLKKMGYSNGLLNVLCLNSEVLKQMFFRNKQINLFINHEQIQELSLRHLMDRVEKKDYVPLKFRMCLTTLDGYNLQVNLTFEKIIDIEEKGRECHFFHFIIKFDIEARDLQGLIEYRKALSKSSSIGFDHLAQVELSQMLEDVEYSVQSQLFMEKYYTESCENLTKLHSEIINQSKQCKFREKK